MKTKQCSRCKRKLPLNEFDKNRSHKDGLQVYCKVCMAIAGKKYKQSEKGKATTAKNWRKRYYGKGGKVQHRRYQFRYRYGITLEQHKQIYLDQNGCCLLCEEPIEYSKIHTDHNHITGEVRGLICARCNISLGHFKVDEKPKLLLKAVKYIKG